MNPLQQLLLDHVPPSLFKHLSDRQPMLYEEASGIAYNSTLWEKPEAETLFPILRRAVMEGELRRIARREGLICEDCRHNADNYGYLVVKAGPLLLTAHHVSSAMQVARPCLSRKQHSAVNDIILQPYFEELLSEPLPALDAVYGNILHGVIHRSVEGKTVPEPFMTISFPHPKKARHVAAWSVGDLLQLYSSTPSPASVESSSTVVLPDVTLKAGAADFDRFEQERNELERRKKAENN
jgi:hypothetical protein